MEAAHHERSVAELLVTNVHFMGIDQCHQEGLFPVEYNGVEVKPSMFDAANSRGLQLLLFFLLTKLHSVDHLPGYAALRQNFPAYDTSVAKDFRNAALDILKTLPFPTPVLNMKSLLTEAKGERVAHMLLMLSCHVMRRLLGTHKTPPFRTATHLADETGALPPGTPVKQHPAALNAIRVLIHRERRIFEHHSKLVLDMQRKMQATRDDLMHHYRETSHAAPESPQQTTPEEDSSRLQATMERYRSTLAVLRKATESGHAVREFLEASESTAAPNPLSATLQSATLLSQVGLPSTSDLDPSLRSGSSIDVVALLRSWNLYLHQIRARMEDLGRDPVATEPLVSRIGDHVQRLQELHVSATQLEHRLRSEHADRRAPTTTTTTTTPTEPIGTHAVSEETSSETSGHNTQGSIHGDGEDGYPNGTSGGSRLSGTPLTSPPSSAVGTPWTPGTPITPAPKRFKPTTDSHMDADHSGAPPPIIPPLPLGNASTITAPTYSTGTYYGSPTTPPMEYHRTPSELVSVEGGHHGAALVPRGDRGPLPPTPEMRIQQYLDEVD